jgi:hypothetical protein
MKKRCSISSVDDYCARKNFCRAGASLARPAALNRTAKSAQLAYYVDRDAANSRKENYFAYPEHQLGADDSAMPVLSQPGDGSG